MDLIRRFGALAAAVIALAACQPAGQPSASPSGAASPSGKIGGSVSVIGVWAGDELDSFTAMVKPFEDQTGVKVNFEGTRDLNTVLATRVQAGNPPDVAGLPGPGQMIEFANAKKLVALDGVLDMNTMRDQYPDSMLKLAQVGGKQYGIFIKAALKGPMWYDPKNFQAKNYQVPKTWDDLMTLSKNIANSGTTPWCIGLENAAASGWPGTDWIEDILLRQSGPDVYDKWVNGTQKWSSAEVKEAFTTWGQIVGDPKMVYGGKQGMLTTSFGDSANPMFANPPKCYLHHQASFITSFITKANPNLKAGEDFNFFMTPDIKPQYAGAVTGAGDLFGMFKETPQSRALIQYLVTPEAQSIWVKRGGALSANKKVTDYPDKISADSAKALTAAKIFRFDGSDLMPKEMNDAFWRAILDFVNDPSRVDSILSNLDSVQARAYKK
jgi:alpha-glucoside transport system substrate-binding protein